MQANDDKSMGAVFVANLIRYRQEGYKPDRDIIVAPETDKEISRAMSHADRVICLSTC